MLKVHCPVILGNWIALIRRGERFLGALCKNWFWSYDSFPPRLLPDPFNVCLLTNNRSSVMKGTHTIAAAPAASLTFPHDTPKEFEIEALSPFLV